MKVRLAVLADAANVSREGKLNILGEFNLIWTQVFPAVCPRMFMVLKVEADPGEAPTKLLRLRFLDQDSQPVGPLIECEISLTQRFRSGVPISGIVMLEFRDAVFPREGTYELEVTSDTEDGWRTEIPLHVFRLPGQVGPGQ